MEGNMSEAKSAKSKWMLVIGIVVGVAVLLGGTYAAGSFILPSFIHSSYQGKNCGRALQLGDVYARFYPASMDPAGTSKLVSECALYKLAASQEAQKSWQEA
jgi:hypothetical protein